MADESHWRTAPGGGPRPAQVAGPGRGAPEPPAEDNHGRQTTTGAPHKGQPRARRIRAERAGRADGQEERNGPDSGEGDGDMGGPRAAGADAPAVQGLDTAVYVVPTDAPAADGTLAWDST